MITQAREAIFNSIGKIIGSTPLRVISKIEVPNGVKIYVKEEYKNPTGSHYDRLTLELFKGYESHKGLNPSVPIVETSTGSSGASFAWMAKILGYENATVIIPKDMPSARIAQIKSYGAQIEFSEQGTYISGLIDSIKKKIDENKRNQLFRFLNHSHDERFSIRAMKLLGKEILTDFRDMEIAPPNYAILALGNGTSALGISSVLKKEGIKIYGMEPFESPAVYKEYFPEKYIQKFEKNHVLSNNHIIYGTGAGCEVCGFPNLKNTAKNYLKDVFHPTRKDVLETRELMMFKEMILAGNSSAACLWSALQLAKDCKDGGTIVTIMYDAAWRYLDLKRDEDIYEL